MNKKLEKFINENRHFITEEGSLNKWEVIETSSLENYNEDNQRELLCDFFKFFRDNGEANIGMSIEQFVDAYLDSKPNI